MRVDRDYKCKKYVMRDEDNRKWNEQTYKDFENE
jgi:hypothetical protein